MIGSHSLVASGLTGCPAGACGGGVRSPLAARPACANSTWWHGRRAKLPAVRAEVGAGVSSAWSSSEALGAEGGAEPGPV